MNSTNHQYRIKQVIWVWSIWLTEWDSKTQTQTAVFLLIFQKKKKKKIPLHPLSTSGASFCLTSGCLCKLWWCLGNSLHQFSQSEGFSLLHPFTSCYLQIARSAHDGWLWSSPKGQHSNTLSFDRLVSFRIRLDNCAGLAYFFSKTW